MSDLPQLVGMLDVIVLPLLGLGSMVWSKIAQGEDARCAERQFLLVLVIFTLVTLRTVINCDDHWLIHTVTLATMIVGALAVPSQRTSVAI